MGSMGIFLVKIVRKPRGSMAFEAAVVAQPEPWWCLQPPFMDFSCAVRFPGKYSMDPVDLWIFHKFLYPMCFLLLGVQEAANFSQIFPQSCRFATIQFGGHVQKWWIESANIGIAHDFLPSLPLTKCLFF